MNYLLVFLGGGLGSILRYAVSRTTPHFYQGTFPMGTLVANILACLFLGLTLLFLKEKTGVADWQLFLITGVCGGFSTFSTFSIETVMLVQTNNYFMAGLNIVMSLVTCITLLFIILKFK